MNIGEMIVAAARAIPENRGVTCGSWTLSYAQMTDRARALAGGLRSRGLSSGDRVVMQMQNGLEYPEVLVGCWLAGVVPVPVNAKLHSREVAHIVENSGARLMLRSEKYEPVETGVEQITCESPAYAALIAAPPLDEIAATVSEDLAWLFYTSGTTGRPKGAMLSHRNLMAMVHAYYADIDQLGPDDVMVIAAPASHGAGLYMLAALFKGAHVIMLPSFDTQAMTDILEEYQNVSLFAVPTTLNRLVDVWSAPDAPLTHLRTIVYGGAPMYQADLERAIDLFGPRLFQLFAQGESPMTITGLPQRLHRRDMANSNRLLSSCGYPRTGVSVRICDPETGAPVKSGQIGEITVQGDTVMRGYWSNDAATTAALRDGWLWTGDLGYADDDGLLHVVDRSKDVIISGGTNIYPREVEEVLLTHERVRECAVVGLPDPEWGENVVAFVVPEGEAPIDPEVLDAHVCARIARFKRPKLYRFVPELPKSNYAKTLKSELRKLLSDEALAG